MVFKYHIKEIILSFLLIFMLFVNIVSDSPQTHLIFLVY